MGLKKSENINSIASNLAYLSKEISLKNAIGLFDDNRQVQDFFRDLFKLIFGYDDLENLDKLTNNITFPAVDLASKKFQLAIQITTDSNSEKIKDTIKKFIDHSLYQTYNRLIIYIIGDKKKYTVTFNTNGSFQFNQVDDIWDDKDIIKKIDANCDLQKTIEIASFLERELEEYKFPDRLIDVDIKRCVQLLKKDFGHISKISNFLSRGHEDFIKEKNMLNKVTWDFFTSKIRRDLVYNEQIDNFLRDPINESIMKEYLDVSSAIQEFYEQNEAQYSSFEQVFVAIFDKLNLYDVPIKGVHLKLKIILHNMYFNCDIGLNPS